MAHFHPPVRPGFLSEKLRDAEREVWESLQRLGYSWHVFYSARENSGSGWDREVDFVLIRLNRIFYCEVKGGVVVVDQRAGPGVTWAHFTRSREPISKRADPKQLWSAKAALGQTIRQIAGQSPRDLGFREHDFYIFPHTPRDVTRGADLERDNIHYAFEEDIAVLPARLQQIVDSGKGRFIDRDRIENIINSLDAMVIKESGGTLPQPTQAAPSPAYKNWRPTVGPSAQRPMRSGHVFRPFRRHRIRLSRLWAVAALLGLFAILGSFTDSSIVATNPSANPISPTPQSLKSAPKPPPRVANAALPSFIAPASAGDVERAIAAAQDLAVYVSWQSDTQYGFVILRSDDGNGCRRYQISRHDLPSAKYDTIRRCSEFRQWLHGAVMMDFPTLLTFAAAAFALALTPGPDMLLVMTRSVAQGRIAGLVTLAGITVGCYGHALVAGFSLSGLLLIAPVMFEVIRWAGAAYLLCLGIQAFRGAGGFQPPRADAPRLPLWSLFRQGLLTNLLNPKVALFFLALFPQFMRPDPETAVWQALILAVVLSTAGGIVNGGIALVAGRLGEWLAQRPNFVRWQNRLLGGVFAAMALRLAFDKR